MMDSTDYASIVAKNLKRIAYEHGTTQAEIARDLCISKTTLSSWMNGARLPRMKKIDLLCKYFGCSRSDILEPYDPNKKRNYQLTPFEIKIIEAYRMADNGIKTSVKILLNVQEKAHGEHQTDQFSA